ncbi:replication associated protein [Chicken smacovirus mg6_1052]|nr:replication associated protein [Chicken smacovirus mg6_1052]
MVTNYMITMPRNENMNALKLLRYINTHDVKKWVIGAEIGKSGYQHWQCRVAVSDDHFYEFEEVFDWIRQQKKKVGTGWINVNIPEAHVEECSDTWDYETKEGRYIASWDTPEVRRLRFGRMTWTQETCVNLLRNTKDREIVVWYDPEGNHGKTWLVGHLYETGQAYYLPPTLTSVQSMLQTMASLAWADREKGRTPKEFVFIDIPRSWRWSRELYTAIESIKDGLIMDPRYSARPINIRGIRVLVMTNTRPELDKLSQDRWVWFNTPMF